MLFPSAIDPVELSPDARTSALATILAAGLLRLRRPIISPEIPLERASEDSSESAPNRLAVSAETSVTVHGG